MKLLLRGGMWCASIILTLVLGASEGLAARVLVMLRDGAVDPQIIAINVGDTVSWQMTSGFSNFTESVGGDWKSPSLTNATSTFSYTFTNTGFFVYRTAGAPGTITVMPWTNSPPLVTIISPIDGFVFPYTVPVPIVATVNVPQTNAAVVAFFVDDTQIDVVTNPPYSTRWIMLPPSGTHKLTAGVQYMDKGGGLSRPVRVSFGTGENGVGFFSPRRLPTGEFVCYYGAVWRAQGWIAHSDAVPFDPLNANSSVWGYGVYVDFSATSAAHRFYSIIGVFGP